MSKWDDVHLQDTGSEYPLVSILVGVYNHAPYIRECLDSIVNTGYPNMEILITNDASPDNSDEIILEWMEKHPDVYVTYILNLENIGIIKSLNNAVGTANGDLLCFIAADDVMLTNGIIDRVYYLQQNPKKLAVFADCHVIDKDGILIHQSGLEHGCASGFKKSDLSIDELIPFIIVFYWTVPGPVFMCRKDTFNIVGLYDEELQVEDWDMYLRIASVGRLGYHDGYVSSYRIHNSNWSRAQDGTVKAKFKETLLDNYRRTIQKNLRRFKGVNAVRLFAYHMSVSHEEAKEGAQKSLLFLAKILTMSFSYRAYMLSRFFYKQRDKLHFKG